MKTVWITGGSRGIGESCVRAFAQAGWRVAYCWREHPNEALARETGALSVQADVSRPQDVAAAFTRIQADFRHIDALVNNAGVSLVKLFQDTTDEDWRRVVDTCLSGAFYCSRAVLPGMLSQGAGAIVNVSSIWGMVGGSMEVAYSAAKAGLLGLTKALAKEAGPSGVTVNAVAPGATRTNMLSIYNEQELAEIAEESPLGRIAQPADVARVILWLCGPDAALLTGQVICPSAGSVIV